MKNIGPKHRQILLKFAFGCGLLALAGCMVAPLLEPIRKGGFTEDSRRALLPARVALFHQLVSQGKYEDAMTIALDESKASIRSSIEEVAEGFTVTGAEVRKRQDDEGASTSRLEVDLQRYKVGRNTLENIRLVEVWEFSHSSGWLIKSLVDGRDVK